MRLRNAFLLFGPIFGYAVGVTTAVLARASEEWNFSAKQIFKRRPRQPKQLSFEEMMERRPKYKSWIRGLNRREPK
jgi:hypothetical protein